MRNHDTISRHLITAAFLLLALWALLLAVVPFQPWRHWVLMWGEGALGWRGWWGGVWGLGGPLPLPVGLLLAAWAVLAAVGFAKRKRWAWGAGMALLLVGFLHPAAAGGLASLSVWTNMRDGAASWQDTETVLVLFRRVAWLLLPLPLATGVALIWWRRVLRTATE